MGAEPGSMLPFYREGPSSSPGIEGGWGAPGINISENNYVYGK